MNETSTGDAPSESDSLSTEIESRKEEKQQSVLKFFGYEITAPEGVKNPRLIYFSFIIFNAILFLVLRNLITGK